MNLLNFSESIRIFSTLFLLLQKKKIKALTVKFDMESWYKNMFKIRNANFSKSSKKFKEIRKINLHFNKLMDSFEMEKRM